MGLFDVECELTVQRMLFCSKTPVAIIAFFVHIKRKNWRSNVQTWGQAHAHQVFTKTAKISATFRVQNDIFSGMHFYTQMLKIGKTPRPSYFTPMFQSAHWKEAGVTPSPTHSYRGCCRKLKYADCALPSPRQRQNGPLCCCVTLFAASAYHFVTAEGGGE